MSNNKLDVLRLLLLHTIKSMLALQAVYPHGFLDICGSAVKPPPATRIGDYIRVVICGASFVILRRETSEPAEVEYSTAPWISLFSENRDVCISVRPPGSMWWPRWTIKFHYEITSKPTEQHFMVRNLTTQAQALWKHVYKTAIPPSLHAIKSNNSSGTDRAQIICH